MAKLEKIGAELWTDLKPGEELRLRDGAALTWFGGVEDIEAAGVKATGAGLKNRAVGMPLMQTSITTQTPTSILAKFGTKAEIWSLKLDGSSVYFKGAFYLGHIGDVELSAKKLSFDNLLFMVEPKGTGTVYLALPKGLSKIPVGARRISTPYDRIALIIGEPEFQKYSTKEEFKHIFRKGGWARASACEMTGADTLYIYGGKINAPMSAFSDDDDD